MNQKKSRTFDELDRPVAVPGGLLQDPRTFSRFGRLVQRRMFGSRAGIILDKSLKKAYTRPRPDEIVG